MLVTTTTLNMRLKGRKNSVKKMKKKVKMRVVLKELSNESLI